MDNNNDLNQAPLEEQPINISVVSEENTENVVPVPEVNAVTGPVVEESVGNKKPKGNKGGMIGVILLFVFFFIYIMGMPYIKDFINDFKSNNGLSPIEKAAKEEEEKQQKENDNKNKTPVEEDTLTEVVCTSVSQKLDNYTLVEVQKFKHNKDKKIKESSVISNYTFTLQDDTYNTLKKKCDEDVLKYVENPGYTMACSYNDENIEISNQFDLEIFKPFVDGVNNITSNTTYNKNIDEVKTEMTSKNYTCK